MTKILLLRHGHVEGITPARFRGRADLMLTEQGKSEARTVAKRISHDWRPDIIYTSPLKRCVDTGAAIASVNGVEAHILDGLNDLDYGTMQMRALDEVREKEPALMTAWSATPHLVRFPDGESLQDVAARSADVLRYLFWRHPGDTVVLVAHDSINRVMLLQLLDHALSFYWRLEQHPCCINEIDVVDGHIRIVRINEAARLNEITRQRGSVDH